MKELIILRGLPGSGKSTLANLICNQHYEADMYFMENGVYKFDASRIKNAHAWCQDMVYMDMLKDVPVIVVSNTFTQEWEMEVYFELAKKYEYRVHTLVVENRHNGENVHGCPVDKIEQMEDRFEIKLY
jgi:predicted kinase